MKSSKLSSILLLTSIIICSCSSNKIEGNYINRFSQSIDFKSDSTFIFKYNYDLASSWTIGIWKMKNDTVYLRTKLIMDTLIVRNKNNTVIDKKLVLSSDQKSNRIEKIEYVSYILSSGGQNKIQPPNKLILKRNKLYLVNADGKIERVRKINGIHRISRTYFKKSKKTSVQQRI